LSNLLINIFFNSTRQYLQLMCKEKFIIVFWSHKCVKIINLLHLLVKHDVIIHDFLITTLFGSSLSFSYSNEAVLYFCTRLMSSFRCRDVIFSWELMSKHHFMKSIFQRFSFGLITILFRQKNLLFGRKH
jgi:hypothetical protein